MELSIVLEVSRYEVNIVTIFLHYQTAWFEFVTRRPMSFESCGFREIFDGNIGSHYYSLALTWSVWMTLLLMFQIYVSVCLGGFRVEACTKGSRECMDCLCLVCKDSCKVQVYNQIGIIYIFKGILKNKIKNWNCIQDKNWNSYIIYYQLYPR